MPLNTEKVLNLLNQMFDTESKDFNGSIYFDLKQYVLDTHLQELAMAKGGVSERQRFNAARKYLKRDQKPRIYSKEKWPGNAWYDERSGTKYQIFSDGRSLFVFNEDSYITGLPEVNEGITGPANWFNLYSEAIYGKDRYCIDRKSLKIAIAQWQADGKLTEICEYPVGPMAHFNAAFLLEVLEILGLEETELRYKNDKHPSPAFIGEGGRNAVLMPTQTEAECRAENDKRFREHEESLKEILIRCGNCKHVALRDSGKYSQELYCTNPLNSSRYNQAVFSEAKCYYFTDRDADSESSKSA